MKRITDQDREIWKAATADCQPLSRVSRVTTTPSIPKMKRTYWEPILDLHNMSLEEAHSSTHEHIDNAVSLGWTRITLITGLSGKIKYEFETWLLKHRSNIKRINQKSGGGAYEIWLRKDS